MRGTAPKFGHSITRLPNGYPRTPCDHRGLTGYEPRGLSPLGRIPRRRRVGLADFCQHVGGRQPVGQPVVFYFLGDGTVSTRVIQNTDSWWPSIVAYHPVILRTVAHVLWICLRVYTVYVGSRVVEAPVNPARIISHPGQCTY